MRKTGQEAMDILRQTQVHSKPHIDYDNPYEKSKFFTHSYDNCIGETNNVRKRKLREGYLEKLTSCGERYNDSQRLEELLRENMPDGLVGCSSRTMTIICLLIIIVPILVIMLIFLLGQKKLDISFFFIASVWTLLGIMILFGSRKGSAKSRKLFDERIENIRSGFFEAYAFTVVDRMYYHQSSTSSSSHDNEDFYYIFTSSGMNFRVEDVQTYLYADSGSKLIILCYTSSDDAMTLTALID